MSKAPKAASYADKIFSAILYHFELRSATDSAVREYTGLTPSRYAAGKRYLRLNPTARLGFSYTSGVGGFRLTCNRLLIERHTAQTMATTSARRNNAVLETQRISS